jgi:hypothetical protein
MGAADTRSGGGAQTVGASVVDVVGRMTGMR